MRDWSTFRRVVFLLGLLAALASGTPVLQASGLGAAMTGSADCDGCPDHGGGKAMTCGTLCVAPAMALPARPALPAPVDGVVGRHLAEGTLLSGTHTRPDPHPPRPGAAS